MPNVFCTTFDCDDPVRQAAFWATVLSYTVDDRNGPDEIVIEDPSRVGHSLGFMKVPETKTGKNRVHLDLAAETTLEEEVDRLVAAGARALTTLQDPEDFKDPIRWTVMQDPEGNEFCVFEPLVVQA